MNGWRLLGFSNVDWGQDLLLVDDWIKSHPNCRPLAFNLSLWNAHRNGELFGLPNNLAQSLPGDLTQKDIIDEGWYIVNVRALYNLPGQPGLQYLQKLEPVDRIGYSFHVYRVGGIANSD